MPQAGTVPPVRWITGYEVAEQVLRHKNFREVTFKGLVPLLGHVICTLEGAEHRQRRSLEGRLFTAHLLKAAERSFVIDSINATLAGLTGEVCLVSLSYAVSARIAARITGLDELEPGGDVEQVVHLLSALVSGTRSESQRLAPLTRRAARDELRKKYIDGAISRRRNLLAHYQAGKLGRADLPADLITLLLLHSNQADPSLDTRKIAGEVAFYAVAAVDTTASLVPHLLHELWNFTRSYPEYNSRLQDLNFLRTAAAEALRLHPAIPTIFRQATAPVELPDGLRFEPGQTAALYIFDINRDPSVFGPDAAEFNPLRTLPARIRRAGLSFGGGSHLCLGRELAMGRPENETGRSFEEKEEDFEEATGLYGSVALLARALLARNARPHPEKPVPVLSPYERNVYHHYPMLLD